MRSLRRVYARAIMFFLTTTVCASAAIPASPASRDRVVAAYYTGNIPVASIPANRLTDLIFAFGEPGAGNVCHRSSSRHTALFAQLRALRSAYPRLRLFISIGGWGAAPQFSDAALTAASRRAFAHSCIDEYVVRQGFDGIDLDWEFPVRGGVERNPKRPQDRADVAALAAEMRRELNVVSARTHRRYYLTAATPAGRWQVGGAYDPAQSYDFPAMARQLDWFNVMAYDLTTSLSARSGFNAPFGADPSDPQPAAQRRYNNVEGAVVYYEAHGVPRDKIVLGVPFYGRGFRGVSARDAGLYSAYSSVGNEIAWKQIEQTMLRDPNWQRHWSSTAQAPWLYNARAHEMFSYDDPQSIAIKADYITRAGLRGGMFWVLGADDAQDRLLQVFDDHLR